MSLWLQTFLTVLNSLCVLSNNNNSIKPVQPAVFVYVFLLPLLLLSLLFILPFVSFICWFNALLFENFIYFITCNAIVRHITECRLNTQTHRPKRTEKRKKKTTQNERNNTKRKKMILFFAQPTGCISNDRSNCRAMNKCAVCRLFNQATNTIHRIGISCRIGKKDKKNKRKKNGNV